MKSISSREARANWRELLDEIQAEQSAIVIERYGKPVGVLVPYEKRSDAPALPTHNEQRAAYETTFAPLDEDVVMNDRREQLLQQLYKMPDALLETAVHLLNALQATQRQSVNVVPISPAHGAQWQGLLDIGYDGDALEDSEALYE